MIRGSFIILLFYMLGEALSVLLRHFVPGSVIGMILLFAALFFKVIKPKCVEGVATALTKNMALFFVPVGVGLMAYFDVIARSWLAIVTAIVVSTILVIVVVAFLQEFFEKRRKKS